MNDMVRLAMRSHEQSYSEGAEDGFWRGYAEGAEANRRYITGSSEINPFDEIPVDFGPLGNRYYARNHATTKTISVEKYAKTHGIELE